MHRRAKEAHVYLLLCGWVTLPRKPHGPIMYTKPEYPRSFRWTRDMAVDIERRDNGTYRNER